MSAVRARAATLLVVLVLGLSGCDFNPGVAANVGNETVTTQHVDEVTDGYCTALQPQLEQQNQRLPKVYLKREVAAKLAVVAALEQLAEEWGVEPSSQYRSEVSSLGAQVASEDEQVREAYVEVASAVPLFNDLLPQIGAIELERQGVTGAKSDDKLTAGREVLARWIDRENAEFSPEYDLTFSDGLPVQADTEISYAFSDSAKQAMSDSPDAGYTATLPDYLVCG